jgi:hypothetical protein
VERRTKVVGTVVVGVALAAGGIGVAAASGGGDAAEGPDVAITGPDLERASGAALAHTGGGEVTGTEVGDEESRYEVEVTLPDGRQVDVQLDDEFRVVGDETDEETEDGTDDGDDGGGG